MATASKSVTEVNFSRGLPRAVPSRISSESIFSQSRKETAPGRGRGKGEKKQKERGRGRGEKRGGWEDEEKKEEKKERRKREGKRRKVYSK